MPLSLDLSCEELVFSLPLDSWHDCAERRLAATNPHPFPVPFRWEAPASGEYDVAPVSGVLQPRKSADFTIKWVTALAGASCCCAAVHVKKENDCLVSCWTLTDWAPALAQVVTDCAWMLMDAAHAPGGEVSWLARRSNSWVQHRLYAVAVLQQLTGLSLTTCAGGHPSCPPASLARAPGLTAAGMRARC